MARVLVFRHVPFEHLGLIADSLSAAALEWSYVSADEPGIPALAAEAAGLISMGGPMSANDDLPWIRPEMDCLARAAARGVPVLGVCLGAQLLAKALGGRVYRNPVKEIGWAPISLTEAARQDALLGGVASPLTVLHWHGETFDLPGGAARLASSDACRNQAFRAGRSAYGLQFHLEVTPEMIAEWCTHEPVAIDPHAQPGLRDVARSVFGRWCALAG